MRSDFFSMEQQALVTKGTRSPDLSQGLGSRGMNGVQSVAYEEAQPFSDFTLGGRVFLGALLRQADPGQPGLRGIY